MPRPTIYDYWSARHLPYACAVARKDGSRVRPGDDDALGYLVVRPDSVCFVQLVNMRNLIMEVLCELGADESVPVGMR